jgi:dephospho-CoA kinase
VSAIRIGLTGPIGCGKSTVASWLAAEGAVVIDADQVSRDVLEPGTRELDAVVAAFGHDLLDAKGRLDRAALGRIVFRDPMALSRLEAIVHPAVRPRILAAIEAAEAAGAPGVVIEAIKLVEGGLALLCDAVWLIRCDTADQRERLRGRGADEQDADARIGAQGDLESRLRPAAHRVIDTSGPSAPVRAHVVEAWRETLQKREARPPEGPRSSR